MRQLNKKEDQSACTEGVLEKRRQKNKAGKGRTSEEMLVDVQHRKRSRKRVRGKPRDLYEFVSPTNWRGSRRHQKNKRIETWNRKSKRRELSGAASILLRGIGKMVPLALGDSVKVKLSLSRGGGEGEV